VAACSRQAKQSEELIRWYDIDNPHGIETADGVTDIRGVYLAGLLLSA